MRDLPHGHPDPVVQQMRCGPQPPAQAMGGGAALVPGHGGMLASDAPPARRTPAPRYLVGAGLRLGARRQIRYPDRFAPVGLQVSPAVRAGGGAHRDGDRGMRQRLGRGAEAEGAFARLPPGPLRIELALPFGEGGRLAAAAPLQALDLRESGF